MNPTLQLPTLTNLQMPSNLPEWIGTAAGVYLFFNGHQVIGAALAVWFGYQAVMSKPIVTLQFGGVQ